MQNIRSFGLDLLRPLFDQRFAMYCIVARPAGARRYGRLFVVSSLLIKLESRNKNQCDVLSICITLIYVVYILGQPMTSQVRSTA